MNAWSGARWRSPLLDPSVVHGRTLWQGIRRSVAPRWRSIRRQNFGKQKRSRPRSTRRRPATISRDLAQHQLPKSRSEPPEKHRRPIAIVGHQFSKWPSEPALGVSVHPANTIPSCEGLTNATDGRPRPARSVFPERQGTVRKQLNPAQLRSASKFEVRSTA